MQLSLRPYLILGKSIGQITGEQCGCCQSNWFPESGKTRQMSLLKMLSGAVVSARTSTPI